MEELLANVRKAIEACLVIDLENIELSKDDKVLELSVNMLAGTLCGAWGVAGRAIHLAPQQLDCVALLLLGLARLLCCSETWLEWPTLDRAWIGDPLLLALA